VIFSRSDNRRVRTLNDLVGNTFMAVTESSFIGWRNTLNELHQHGIAPGFDFEQIVFGQTHPAVVMAVRDGLVAAGTVAAGTLESMATQGMITLTSFRILNQVTAGNSHFPFLRSTRLTPEWPLAVMPHVPRRLTEQVARRLLALTPESNAAQAAQLAGWTPALNYQSVHAAMLNLRRHAHSKITLPTSAGVHALIFFMVLTAGFVGAIWRHQRNGSRDKMNSVCVPSVKQSETQAKVHPAGAVNATSQAAGGHECQGKQLHDMNATAEAVQTAKGQFLANMNHEIRTPLNGIVSMVELLMQSTMADEHLEYVTIIQQSAKALVSIVDDVMDYCNIETGRIKIEVADTELAAAVVNTAQAYARIAQAKGIGFSCVIDPNLPIWIRCDPIRLRQVLDNLLNNAVKFTQKGTIHLHVALKKRYANKITAKFQIGDSGIGIHSDRLTTLFDSFSQGDGTAIQKPEGIGLGLTIAKQLIDLMGGKIQVESTPGIGTRFWFCIDFEVIDMAQPSSKDAGGSTIAMSDPGSSAYILLVEDNLVNQKVASKILTKSGYQVDVVENGRLALDILKKNPYDLILMDIQMPEMDGLEATRRIRQTDSGVLNNNIPIIAVTANAMNTDQQQCLEHGMNDYLTKPINPAKLLEVIAQWLPAKRNPQKKCPVPQINQDHKSCA
jgi:CheY-like chemotaxis protein